MLAERSLRIRTSPDDSVAAPPYELTSMRSIRSGSEISRIRSAMNGSEPLRTRHEGDVAAGVVRADLRAELRDARGDLPPRSGGSRRCRPAGRRSRVMPSGSAVLHVGAWHRRRSRGGRGDGGAPSAPAARGRGGGRRRVRRTGGSLGRGRGVGSPSSSGSTASPRSRSPARARPAPRRARCGRRGRGGVDLAGRARQVVDQRRACPYLSISARKSRA